MPFTLAHPAAVVFIKNKYFNLSGLILGSMAPDFIYFILFNPISNIGHTVLGSIVINIPICFILNYIYYKYIKDQFILNLPRFISKNYMYLINEKNRVTNLKEGIIFTYSSIIGMITHVFWDSFTHKTGYFVLKLNFLRSDVDFMGHKIYIYKIAQHGGTLIGFTLILIFLYKIRSTTKTVYSTLNIATKNKLIYHGVSILISLIIFIFSYGAFSFSFSVGRAVVTFINGLFLGCLAMSVVYSYKFKNQYL